MGGPNTRYWVIQGDDEAISTIENGSICSIAQHSQQVHEELERNARNEANLQEGLDHNSPWVKEMQWVKFVGNRDSMQIPGSAVAGWSRSKRWEKQVGSDSRN